ncbi:hypothetical protein HDG32_003362 [Paraburkholderia sp. CI2]|uniref:hypothetical protein n=1 Tax=Paraburkholderia sp. CI2 TaxID=2723093 RepID=UPI00161513BD|nr:hypothetical protein [Paraburkholderia sp. CI2]MBB5467242.1 hypothetical protein [Paraburkholderia sp. CI2]
MIDFFRERTDMSALAAADLEWLGGATDAAQTMAGALSDTLAGLANLICDSKGGAPQLGEGGIEQVLWGAADSLTIIAALSFVASEADFVLLERISCEVTALGKEPGARSARAKTAASSRKRGNKDSSQEADHA